MDIISKLNGNLFEKLVIAGALNLKANIEEVNNLNVFPIPDGDTGDNMFLTISGGIESLKNENNNSLGMKAEALASGMMLSARGNSGVILSQLFNGLAMGLKDVDEADLNSLCDAFRQSVKQAYSAVVKPVEGTILTVAREGVEYACASGSESINDFMKKCCEEMQLSLDRTPELLDTLKEAGVIDSGGAGLLYIVEGMNSVLEGKDVEGDLNINESKQSVDFSKFNEESVMEYGYCTEFLLQLQNCKVNPLEFDEKVIIEYLETIGDSIVCYKTGTVVKVHVHTLMPYKALEFSQKFGEFLTVKIENMTLQHSEVQDKEKKNKKRATRKKYSTVVVATGSGLIDTFSEMGVDYVIDGGQGKNPSTKDFLEAFEYVNSDNIFVLPNNSNIILTASEAKDLYNGSNIYIINTKNFGEAYSCLSVLDYGVDDCDEIVNMLCEAKDNVVTGMITKAVRDSNINSVEIHEGDYIGFSDKTMYTSNVSKIDAYFDMIDKLDVTSKAFIINVYGSNMTDEEKVEIESILQSKYPLIEFYTIDGGQDVYDIIVILE